MNYFKYLLKENKRILIFGKNGQLSTTFRNKFGTHTNVLALGSSDVNFLNPDVIPSIINDFKPNFIINTSAYTDVNKAEINQRDAFQINGDVLKYIGYSTKKHNAVLVHYSTDYIFDGKKSSKYKPNHIPNPLNVYGKSKLLGEQNIINSGCNYFIFRISWLVSEFGSNFLKKIILKLINNEELFIINDQIGSPISTSLVTKVTSEILSINNFIKPKHIFHLSTKGSVSWYDIALYIQHKIETNNLNSKINPIKSSQFNSLVERPKNSLFDHSNVEKIIKTKIPFWKDDLDPVIKQTYSNLFNNN